MTGMSGLIWLLPFVAMFGVFIVLALGTACIQVRDWFSLRKLTRHEDEFEQNHGFKPHRKENCLCRKK